MRKKFIVIIGLLIFSCSKNDEPILFKFNNGGLERSYLLHIPNNLKPGSPLVFVLHGLGGTADGIRKYSQMDKVADENGFVVCYPQGTGGSEDTKYTKKGTPFWNVGYEVHKNETVNDIDFIINLALFLQKKYNLDPEKTFCSGMSNGGDMSYLLGCQASDVFKAIAPITGCMMESIYSSCNSNNPVPVFHVHGTSDNTTYYNGDEDNSDGWGAYMSVENTIKLWVNRNECKTTIIDTLPNIDMDDGSIVVTYKNINGINKNEVWFYKIIDGDHEWPQGWPKDSGNQDLNTSLEIWNFFNHYIEQRKI